MFRCEVSGHHIAYMRTHASQFCTTRASCLSRPLTTLRTGPCAGALAAVAPKQAQAIELPFHNSIGGGGKKGSLPPSQTASSMSAYGMEGIKKQGVKPSDKKKVLDDLKAEAAKGK